jgi:hypothetical protein
MDVSPAIPPSHGAIPGAVPPMYGAIPVDQPAQNPASLVPSHPDFTGTLNALQSPVPEEIRAILEEFYRIARI